MFDAVPAFLNEHEYVLAQPRYQLFGMNVDVAGAMEQSSEAVRAGAAHSPRM